MGVGVAEIGILAFLAVTFLTAKAARSTFGGRRRRRGEHAGPEYASDRYRIGGCRHVRTPFRPVAVGRPDDPCVARRAERDRAREEARRAEWAAADRYRREVGRRGSRVWPVLGLTAVAALLFMTLLGYSRVRVAHGPHFAPSEVGPGSRFEEFGGFGHAEHVAESKTWSNGGLTVRFNYGAAAESVARHATYPSPPAPPPIPAPPAQRVEVVARSEPLEAEPAVEAPVPTPPASTPGAPPPDWTSAATTRSGGRYVTVMKSDFFPTREACYEQIRGRLNGEFIGYCHWRYGAVPGGLTAPPDLASSVIKREHLETVVSERLAEIIERTVVPSGDPDAKPETPGLMYRLHAQVEFTEDTPGLRESYRSALVRFRTVEAVVGFGVAVGLLGMVGAASWLFGGRWPR